jgi:Arc/MetJ-type ribon-helix-helix transcriptional regulator
MQASHPSCPPSRCPLLAEAAVQEQAAQVRSLKQDQGLGNASDEVQAAVQELLERKATLEALQQRAAAASEAAA